MPFGTAIDPLTIIKGEPFDVYLVFEDEGSPPTPHETVDYEATGYLSIDNGDGTNTIIPLEDDSALEIDDAGVVTGTIQADVTTQLPEGMLTTLTIRAAPDASSEPLKIWVNCDVEDRP